MKEVLISVIVPVYNTSPWLRRCLDSICEQTYRNLEILCVNDGSTDNSAEILEEYAAKDSRIKVFTQENAGLSAARNTALNHASGEWVTGVDSDDYLEPNVYAHAVACLAEGVDMVFFGVMVENEMGSPMPFDPYFSLPEMGCYQMTPDLAEKLNVCFWSKLWRRNLLEQHKLRFPAGLVHEDEALYYLCVPHVGQVASCSVVGYHYVQRCGSIMNAGGLIPAKRVLRYEPMVKYVYDEYSKRGMLMGDARAYLVKMFVRLFSWVHGADEVDDELHSFCWKLVRSYEMHKEDFRLERLLPDNAWTRLFITRHERSKVYRFFCVPVWVNQYADDGRLIDSYCMLIDTIKRVLR